MKEKLNARQNLDGVLLLVPAVPWRRFFECCAELLVQPQGNGGWMSWTTYQRLMGDAGYWTGRFPDALYDSRFRVEGATPDEEFFYGELAHVVVPRCFASARRSDDGAHGGLEAHEQDIEALSLALDRAGIDHEISTLALQIRGF